MPELEFPIPRRAAAVILVRERPVDGEVEVFLVRRHGGASFMSSAHVFPGGIADPGEDDLRVTAARELLEEAGVFLGPRTPAPDALAAWRQALNNHQPMPAAMSQVLDVSGLHYYAEWITPSTSKKRFAATFYIAVLPADQEPTIDHKEAVDCVWVTPDEALERSRELRLPPPQVRTFIDMQPAARTGMSALIDSAGARARHPHAIMPRLTRPDKRMNALVTMVLPWDPEYLSAGVGDALPMSADHPLAVGASRFVLEDQSWKNIGAPTLPGAE